METHHISRIVTGCLVGGLVVALALVLGPVAGAQEHVITGTILLTFAASWALLATLSMRWTDQPQRWAFAPGSFMALAGADLLAFAPNGEVVDDRMATLSTNSSHRVVPYTHNALVTDRTAAQTSIHAIRDVVHAVRSNAALDKSL